MNSHKQSDHWTGFKGRYWQDSVDVPAFIHHNHTPFYGDGSFLSGPSEHTAELLRRADAEPRASTACEAVPPHHADTTQTYGRREEPLDSPLLDMGNSTTRACRSSGLIIAPPTQHGFNRLVGDFRRIALYGVNWLVQAKESEIAHLHTQWVTENVIGGVERLMQQVQALTLMSDTAASYGHDISEPASTAREALLWMYFGHVTAYQEEHCTTITLGRTATFMDIFFQRDLARGSISEEDAQELIDEFFLKLWKLRAAQTPRGSVLEMPYVAETIGGIGDDGRPLVTKTSFRYLQSLYNMETLRPATFSVLWSPLLPQGFKTFAAQAAIDTSSVQFVSAELVRRKVGDDAAIADGVCALAVGKMMQFPGACINLPKALLHAINGGCDEQSGEYLSESFPPIFEDVLDFHTVSTRFDVLLDWLAMTAVRAANVARYAHDRHSRQVLQTALYDRDPTLAMTFCVEGLSTAVDSLSAIKYAKVKPLRDERGLTVGFETEGTFPEYGNNDDRVDGIAAGILHDLSQKLLQYPTQRGTFYSLSLPLCASGADTARKTGGTPDGRGAGESFAPGGSPSAGHTHHSWLVSALSAAKLSYEDVDGGIAFTATVRPDALGRTADERAENLSGILNGFAASGGYHLKVNVAEDIS